MSDHPKPDTVLPHREPFLFVTRVVERGEAAPTQQSYQVFQHLDGMLQTELIRLNTIIQQDL